MTDHRYLLASIAAAAGCAASSRAQTTIFSTNGPDFRMAAASHPETLDAIETETADDFVLTTDTRITGATFIGFIPRSAPLDDIQSVMVKIYRLFPLDSNAVRTPRVPTRANSPSDGSFQFRDSLDGDLNFSVLALTPSLTAANSVIDGIHPSPGQTTTGDGPVGGDEVEIDLRLTHAIDLPPGHYFFVPLVTLRSGTFLWLSAPKPIVSPGTPFGEDLQAWIRSDTLFPDWLRIGQDIVGGAPAPAFNMVLQLRGEPLCYPNCDGSTSAPVLNVADFSCFINAFSAGQPYANCDGSTAPPILNVQDFVCFMSRFVAGCP